MHPTEIVTRNGLGFICQRKHENNSALPRKVPAMSRFLTKQSSMEIYWRKGGGEQIGALFFNIDGWCNFKKLRGGP